MKVRPGGQVKGSDPRMIDFFIQRIAGIHQIRADHNAKEYSPRKTTQRPLGAEASARRALTLDARNADAHNILGNVLAGREAWEEAAGQYRQAIAGDPQRPIFHHNLGHALQQAGSEAAEVAYRKAIALDPRFAPAYTNLGGLLVKQERYKEAQAALQRAISLDPENVDAYNNLGLASRMLGFFSRAIR